MVRDEEKPASIRLTQEVLDRADALVPLVQAMSEYKALRISRHVVLKLAVLKGLEVLEKELKGEKP